MTEIKFLKLAVFLDDDGRNPFDLLAFVDFSIPAIGATISGARLTYTNKKGYRLIPPIMPPGSGRRYPLTWDFNNPAMIEYAEMASTLYCTVIDADCTRWKAH